MIMHTREWRRTSWGGLHYEPPGRHCTQDARPNGQNGYHPDEVSHAKIDFADRDGACVYVVVQLLCGVQGVVLGYQRDGVELQPNTVPTQA
jgi:hypothetical protein